MSILQRLEIYMLNKENTISSSNLIENKIGNNNLVQSKKEALKSSINSSNKERKIKSNDMVYAVDELFWVCYKLIYGYEKFQLLGNKNISVEKNEKINFIEPLRKIKNVLKTHKLRILEIEDILVNSNKIDIKTFFSLATLYKMNILMVFCKKNIYFEIKTNDTDLYHIVKMSDNNNKIDVDENCDGEIYRSSCIKFDNFDIKLKVVSAYTLLELNFMAKQFNIHMDDGVKKATKAVLYEKINTYLLCN